MYTILISILIGSAAGGVWTVLGLWKTWQMGILLGVLVALISFVLISRFMIKRLEPQMLAVQKQMEGGQPKLAMQSLAALMPMASWQVMLKGQLHAQMGLIAYSTGDEKEARSHLEQAGLKAPEARVTLAAIQYRNGEKQEARNTLDLAIRASKKQLMPYHVYAWMAAKDGDREEAINKLLACQKIEPSNETTAENLRRLQNGKKLTMKPFGITWIGLKLEKPPAEYRQAQGVAARKGFRQKPQRRR